MDIKLKQAFQTLDLDAGSSLEAVQKRYHDLAAVWHPDLHASNSRLQALASEKMKEINSAHEIICSYLKNHLIVICAFCGAKNRIRVDLNLDYAACSRCGKQLREPVARKFKTPCGNSRCAGTIGSNGRCNYCGKTIEEGQNRVELNAEDSHPNTPTLWSIRIKKLALPPVFLSGLVMAFYAYRDNLHDWMADSRPAGITQDQPVADRSSVRIGAPNADKEKPAIFRTSMLPAMPDPFYLSALLNNPKIKKEEAVKLQQVLKTIGYEIGEADGLMGTKTISCFKQFCIDFGYLPQENFPDCFFKTSFLHHQIAMDHKDWLDIYLTNDLENWIRTLPDSQRQPISQLALNQPNTAVQLIRRYKFEKFKPIPAPLPRTGIFRRNDAESTEHLKIQTRTENNHYYIKIMDPATAQEILTAFIRSGDTLSVKLPAGVYDLKYAAGPNWYGLGYLFGTWSSYGKLPQPIVLTPKSVIGDARTIDLVPSRHGRLTTDVISEYDF